MKNRGRMRKSQGLLLVLLLLVLAGIFLLTSARKEKEPAESRQEEAEEEEKGYGLSVSEEEVQEAQKDCREKMNLVEDLYQSAEKGTAQNAVISRETAKDMMEVLGETGASVSPGSFWLNMKNGEDLKEFLEETARGKSGETVVYEIHTDGGLGRKKFCYDGENMYEIYVGAFWKEEGGMTFSEVTRTRLRKWEYTGKGWFLYEYCVPEPPEVTEIVNSYEMMRVREQEERLLELEERWLLPLGYQGSSLLAVDWTAENLSMVEPGSAFSGLYAVEHGQKPSVEQYPEGVPAEEFETLFTRYLPVSVSTLRQWADYDAGTGRYAVDLLGYGSTPPGIFGTSVPEITGVTENPDGTLILETDAVCEMAGQEAAMSHCITVRLEGDRIQYLGNRKK